MPEDFREPDMSDLYGLVLSSSAKTRARFSVILQSIARVVAKLEDREQAEVLEELRQQVEREMEAESEELKEYFMRAPRRSSR